MLLGSVTRRATVLAAAAAIGLLSVGVAVAHANDVEVVAGAVPVTVATCDSEVAHLEGSCPEPQPEPALDAVFEGSCKVIKIALRNRSEANATFDIALRIGEDDAAQWREPVVVTPDQIKELEVPSQAGLTVEVTSGEALNKSHRWSKPSGCHAPEPKPSVKFDDTCGGITIALSNEGTADAVFKGKTKINGEYTNWPKPIAVAPNETKIVKIPGRAGLAVTVEIGKMSKEWEWTKPYSCEPTPPVTPSPSVTPSPTPSATPSPTVPPGKGGGSLPVTGTNLMPFLMVAVGALGLGTALVVWTRRSRTSGAA